MLRAALFLSLFFTSLVAAAQTHLVVLVDINCPFCRQLHQIDSPVVKLAKEKGVDFRYAPVPNDADFKTAWAEKVFYACPKVAGCDSDKLLSVIYDAQDARKLSSLADVQVWLDAAYPVGRTVIDNLLKEAQKEESQAAVIRALRLAGAVKITQFPTFAVVGDGDPYQIASGKDDPLAKRVGEIMNWLKKANND